MTAGCPLLSCGRFEADATIAGVPSFCAADGTELAYHVYGDGVPLLCVPGGPMRESAYLGDLGGLSARRQLIMLDLRGTGKLAIPADPGSYRRDRLVDDVAALQEHLGLVSVDLLAHSAGANIAIQYAARHGGQVSKLALITASARAIAHRARCADGSEPGDRHHQFGKAEVIQNGDHAK